MSSASGRMVRLRQLLAVVTAACVLWACGGGRDDSAAPAGPLGVEVTVGDAPGPLMRLEPDSGRTVQVLSGQRLRFDSDYGTGWTIKLDGDAQAAVESDDAKTKAVVVSGSAARTIVFTFSNPQTGRSTRH